LNSTPKTWLVACFTVSILAGFVRSVFTSSKVEGRSGDEVITTGFAIGTLTCVFGHRPPEPAALVLPSGGGEFLIVPEIGGRLLFKITKLDLNFVNPVTHLSITGELSQAEGTIAKDCLPQQVVTITGTVTGDIQSDCLGLSGRQSIRGHYEVEVSFFERLGHSTFFTGTFDGNTFCKRNPTLSSGQCQTGANTNDNLVGTAGNDCIIGNSGNDKLLGGSGNDKLNGGEGKDLLVGGDGNDELTGGKGSDKFQCGAGNDKITDFKASEGDKKTNDCEQF